MPRKLTTLPWSSERVESKQCADRVGREVGSSLQYLTGWPLATQMIYCPERTKILTYRANNPQ